MHSSTTDLSTPVIYVVDDDEGMRLALVALLENLRYRIVTYSSPETFLAEHSPNQYGCVVLDIRMPTMNGLDVQQQLNAVGSMLPVIFISGYGDIPIAVQAMREGAFDFVQKPFREEDIVDRITRALKQDADNRQAVMQRAELQRRYETLTQRECQVFKMVTDGKANKTMAQDLGLSERTVEIHRANMMEKLSARSVAHLVKMSMALHTGKENQSVI